MSEGNWDSEEFEVTTASVVLPVRIPVVTDKWDGEDEDEETRNNWDDDEEEKAHENTAAGTSTAIQVKKKKPLKERLAEIEEQKRKEAEEKKKKDEEARRQMTPKEQQEERLRQRKRDEEADLALALEAFGLSKNDNKPVAGEIDALTPSTKEEFDKLSELLVNKSKKFENSPLYASFLESLYRNLALSLEAEDVKKLASTLSALATEKAKLKPKAGKKGAKKGKASLVVGKDTDNINDDNAGGYVDDFDDYL